MIDNNKDSCRILISMQCNYRCRYCCNNKEQFSKLFKKARLEDLNLDNYSNICISGGEPLIEENKEKLDQIIIMTSIKYKQVYIYTNLSVLPTYELIKNVTGWSIGFHPVQVETSVFIKKVKKLRSMGATNIRILVQACELHRLKELEGDFDIKAWDLNDCDITQKEDWILLV